MAFELVLLGDIPVFVGSVLLPLLEVVVLGVEWLLVGLGSYYPYCFDEGFYFLGVFAMGLFLIG